jgi:hypothetical protein
MIVIISPCAPAPQPKRWAGMISEGHDPDTIASMRYAGSEVDCLRSRLGTAAGLTVDESGL